MRQPDAALARARRHRYKLDPVHHEHHHRVGIPAELPSLRRRWLARRCRDLRSGARARARHARAARRRALGGQRGPGCRRRREAAPPAPPPRSSGGLASHQPKLGSVKFHRPRPAGFWQVARVAFHASDQDVLTAGLGPRPRGQPSAGSRSASAKQARDVDAADRRPLNPTTRASQRFARRIVPKLHCRPASGRSPPAAALVRCCS